MMSEQKQSTEGKPMYVESLMTKEEWNRRMKVYPSTSTEKYDNVNLHKTNSFKWRLGMGSGLSGLEIGIINKRLDAALKKVI